MKKLLSVIGIFSILLLGACGSNEGSDNHSGNGHGENDGELAMLNADLTVPQKAEKGETVMFTTHVSQGDENITDATEVKYEIWKEGHKEESEMIEAEHSDEGNYSAEKAFEEDGVYHVQVHVTANNMHTMPKKQIAVGDAEAHESHSSEEGDHDHGQGEVSFHLMKPESIEAGVAAELKVMLKESEEPLTQADVRYEIWLEGQEKHDWVETEEADNGTYTGEHEFTQAGTYHITVHVENDEGLHEHSEEKITVQ